MLPTAALASSPLGPSMPMDAGRSASATSGAYFVPMLPPNSLSAHLAPSAVADDSIIRFPFALSAVQPAYVLQLVEHVDAPTAAARLAAVADAIAINREELHLLATHLNALDAALRTAATLPTMMAAGSPHSIRSRV